MLNNEARLFKGAHDYFLQEIRFNEEGGLEITSTQMQHAGRYTCFVSNLAGNDSITYILKVEGMDITVRLFMCDLQSDKLFQH